MVRAQGVMHTMLARMANPTPIAPTPTATELVDALRSTEIVVPIAPRYPDLPPDAEQLLRRVGAPARHHARVAATLQAAYRWIVVRGGAVEHTVLGIQAILELDRMGVGGRLGLEGRSTARHPAFAALGKGRKQASDGSAWQAARDDAARLLDKTFGGIRWDIDEGVIYVDRGEDDVVPYPVPFPASCRVWQRALAGLAMVSQANEKHPQLEHISIRYINPDRETAETLAEWAAVYSDYVRDESGEWGPRVERAKRNLEVAE